MERIPLSSQVLAISSTFECPLFSDTCTEEEEKKTQKNKKRNSRQKDILNFPQRPPRRDGGPSLRPLFV